MAPGFLRNEGPFDKVQALIDQIPDAEAAISAPGRDGALARRPMGRGLMAVDNGLTAVGLGVEKIEGVARELFRFGRDKIGVDHMGDMISGTQGFSQFG